MNKNPEILMAATTASRSGLMAAIPVTSPYYDRLRSLNIQMDFVPYGSPEYHYLEREIAAMEQRAQQRTAANMAINI